MGFVRLIDSPDSLAKVYQNPEDFPPGGFLTLMQARTPDLSNSSAKKKNKLNKRLCAQVTLSDITAY